MNFVTLGFGCFPDQLRRSAPTALTASETKLAIESREVPDWPDDPGFRAAWALLGEEERAAASRLVHDAARCQHVVGRGLAKTMLAELCGDRVDPAAIRFRRDPGGKPHVDRPPAARRPMNLSHTRGMAVCVVWLGPCPTTVSVGVDVERIDRRTDIGLADRYFAVEERRQIAAEPDAQRRRELFFRLWTLKEAFVKSTGSGLRTPLDSFAFDAASCRMIRRDGGSIDHVDAVCQRIGQAFRVAAVVTGVTDVAK